MKLCSNSNIAQIKKSTYFFKDIFVFFFYDGHQGDLHWIYWELKDK